MFVAPALSPDGERVAYGVPAGPGMDTWVYEFRRGITLRLTNDPGIDVDAVWSPDGGRLAYRGEGRDGGRGHFLYVPPMGQARSSG